MTTSRSWLSIEAHAVKVNPIKIEVCTLHLPQRALRCMTNFMKGFLILCCTLYVITCSWTTFSFIKLKTRLHQCFDVQHSLQRLSEIGDRSLLELTVNASWMREWEASHVTAGHFLTVQLAISKLSNFNTSLPRILHRAANSSTPTQQQRGPRRRPPPDCWSDRHLQKMCTLWKWQRRLVCLLVLSAELQVCSLSA